MDYQHKLQLMEDALREYYRFSGVGRLLKGIVHNMNGPLQSLTMQVDLLKHRFVMDNNVLKDIALGNLSGEEVDEFVKRRQNAFVKFDQMNEVVWNLHNMINMILVKCEHEDKDGRRFIDLNNLILEELELLNANMFFKHQVEKEIKLDEDMPRVHGYYVDFSMAFLNIVQNSLDALEGAPVKKLSIRTVNLGKSSFIEISDTGHGIKKEIIPYIFDPFYTTHEVSEVKAKHMGLGLYLSRKILMPYNVQLIVESKNNATVVRFDIPNLDFQGSSSVNGG